MADELIALFTTLVTDDHDDLIAQFSNIMKTDQEVARFFLEASSWNVEKAVHNFLASYGNMQADQLHTTRSAPEVKLLSDLSEVQSVSFGPRSFIPMSWRFMNAGQEAWPADTRLVFVDGERMSGPTETPLQGVNPGEETYVNCRLRAPSGAGTYAGTWRMVCNAGYFGDPLWIIITVRNPAEGDDGSANGLVYFDKDGQKVSAQEFKQQQQRQQQQQQQLLQSQRNRTRPQYTQFAQFHPSQCSGHQFTGDHISEPQEAMFDVDDDADDADADDADADDVDGGGGGVSVSASVRNGIGNGHVPQPLFNNTGDDSSKIHQQGSIGMGMAPRANRFPPLQPQPQSQQQQQQPQPQQQQAQHVHDQFALPSSALFSQSQAPPHTHTQPQPQPSTMQGFGNTGGVSAGAPPTSSGGIQLSQPSFQVNSGLSSMFSLQQNPQYPNQQQQQQQQQQGQQPHQHQLHQQQPQQQGGANVNHEMDL